MTIGAVSNYGMGLGLGSLNYSQYQNDPYFLQALQSPNYYQMQAQNMQQAGTQLPTATATANPSFKGASEEISEKSEKKSNKAAKWVLGTLATAGTIFAAWKCHGKGIGENWYSKIWDGAKRYWNQGIEAISKWKFNLGGVKASPAGIPAPAATLALPAPTVTLRGFEFANTGEGLRCIRDGVEYSISDLPSQLVDKARKALGMIKS